MERGKPTGRKKKSDKKIWWRKLGRGTFRMINGKIIKPNQKFLARASDIPEAFRDVVTVVKETDELMPPETAPIDPVASSFILKHRGGGWFDVVDDEGKVKNETAMHKDAAEKLIAELG